MRYAEHPKHALDPAPRAVCRPPREESPGCSSRTRRCRDDVSPYFGSCSTVSTCFDLSHVGLRTLTRHLKEHVHGFVQEVAVMTRLHHPNICMIMGVATSAKGRRLCIVTELLSVGSL